MTGHTRNTLFCLVILAALTAVLALPFQMSVLASKGLSPKTKSHEPNLPNYDIRTDRTAIDKIASFRSAQGKAASDVADIRDGFARGEAGLRQRVPTLTVEYNTDIRTPEVIGANVRLRRAFLTGPTTPAGTKHADVLIDFLKQNVELIGADVSQIDGLKRFADYTNPDGNLSFVELDQEVNGIPVFRGEVKAGFTRRGEMVRVVNNLAPGLDYDSLSTEFGDPLTAVRAAFGLINSDASKLDLRYDKLASTEKKAVFGTRGRAVSAEKMYFPTEPGVAVPAWRVLIWQPVNAYYVIVDAATHTMLWRKNIVEDQSQPATYSIYANPNATINIAHNPFPLSPGPTAPNGVQGAAIARTPVTRVGNEPPYTFNNLGWMRDGVIKTDGNAVQAGLDRDGIEEIDASGEAFSNVRDFTYSYSPFDPNTNTGDNPVPQTQTYPGSAFQQGSLTQLFYTCNLFHDEAYLLGFTEQARNFQYDNFGRGGERFDHISAEGQDSLGSDGANFGTPADGDRGRMQVYLWLSTNPDIDGNLDTEVVLHELTHGLSNRLHGNASGLTGLLMSRGMGEGWSDFYSISLLSQPTDPINTIYAIGSYDTYHYSTIGNNNNYYGIRRFPYAVKAFTGPNGNSHNPVTFADIDSTQLDLGNAAFPPRLNSGAADAVHNAGEIWCSALLEVRARLITRLGAAAGNRKMLQMVTDAMKLSPITPTFLTGRDAIIAAALASTDAPDAAVDVADVWSGFATRGIGASSSIQNVGGGGGTARVTEAFDLPNLNQAPDISISDAAGNGNGFPEPGEALTVTIPLTNVSGNTAAGTTLQIVGGGSANYGNIDSGSTVTRDATYTVSASAGCGSVATLTINVNSSLGPVTFTRTFAVGRLNSTFAESFETVTAPAFPAGWTAVPLQGGVNFVTTTITPDSGANAAFALDPPNTGGGTDLTSPPILVSVAASTLTFRQKFITESGWDGGVLEISIAGGAFQDIVTAGGTFLQNGYNSAIGPNGVNNPLGGRIAWTGDSGGYVTTVVRLPAAAVGQSVRFKWRFGADDNGVGHATPPGWWIDSIDVAGTATCTTPEARADFDADGRTDLSVFRPADGNWYVLRSTEGFFGVGFGTTEDVLTPGDFDGDGRTDVAVWRPSTGTWYRLNSATGTFFASAFGSSGDIPQPGDFDGDGLDDLAVFRPGDGVWYRFNSSNGQFVAEQFGTAGDLPVAGDYDGDGKDDLTVYRAGVWYRLNSGNGAFYAVSFGLATDLPVPADYDGDDRQDIAVYRPSEGNWYRFNSRDGQFVAINFGLAGDIPVPGDYDGDGRDDQAVYRGGTWYLNRSTAGFTSAAFGVTSDIPVPSKYTP